MLIFFRIVNKHFFHSFIVKVAAASKHPVFGRHKQVAPESAESGHQAPPQGFQQVIQVLACFLRYFHSIGIEVSFVR
jgi:hypothetical protein